MRPLPFDDLLRLLEERSDAFRTAVDAAPGLGLQVPTCPEWTLLDLVQHLGTSHRRWAATVAAGPADAPPHESAWTGEPAPAGREALLAWSAASTQRLLSALSEAGPERGCWTWWGGSQSPQTSGAVARHQVQHVTVHAYDAQATAGAGQPLPEQAALDGVEEFLVTSCAGPYPWPHQPAVVAYHALEGRSWRLTLSSDGARAGTASDREAADASLRGTASELVLALHGRIPVRSLQVDGDERVFDRLLAWEPDA